MTTLNFVLTRARRPDAGEGRRDPRHAARPRRQRLAVARARARPRPRGRLRRGRTTTRRSTSTTSSASSPSRTRVVAFTLASNAVGTLTDARRIVELAHAAGALAWVDAVHYAPHGPIDVAELGRRPALLAVQVLRPASRARVRPRRARWSAWRTYKVRPRDDHRSRRARSRTSCSPASSPRSSTSSRSAGRRSRRASARSGSSSSTACPRAARSTACRRWRAASRPSPSTSRDITPRAVAEHLADRDIAVWDGDYYAVEIMERLGLGSDGAVRAGFVHYNTAAEVDGLLSALREIP